MLLPLLLALVLGAAACSGDADPEVVDTATAPDSAAPTGAPTAGTPGAQATAPGSAATGSPAPQAAQSEPAAQAQEEEVSEREQRTSDARNDARRLAQSQEDYAAEHGQYAANFDMLKANGLYNRDRMNPNNEFATCGYDDYGQFVVAVRPSSMKETWFVDSGGDYEPVQENPGKCELEFRSLEG